MAPQVELITELKMIQKGPCVYCTRGLPHPLYSQCRRKAEKVASQRETIARSFDFQGGWARATA